MSAADDWRRGGARAWMLEGRDLALSLAPARGIAAEAEAEVERVWGELLVRVPQMFDGPTLAVERWDPEAMELTCRRSSYRPFAAGLEGAPVDEWLIAVTGFVTALDEDGRECVMFGRRGSATWLYVGMWELGPSGGVGPVGDGGALGIDRFGAALRDELREEASLEAAEASLAPLAVCTDPEARSLDVVLPARVEGVVRSGVSIGHKAAGEYSEIRWVSLEEVERFCAEAPGGVIGPTRALVRAMAGSR